MLELVEEVPKFESVIFDPTGTFPGCIHDYWDASKRMLDGESIVTSQMGLLNSAKKYRRISILADDKMAVLVKSPDTKNIWLTTSTDKEVRMIHNLFHMWQNGVFEPDVPCVRPNPATKTSTFMGTPIECEAWLRRELDIHRNYIKGATSDLVDGEFVAGEKQDEMLEKFERSVYEVNLRPLDVTATDRMRTSMIGICSRIETERDITDIMLKNTKGIEQND